MKSGHAILIIVSLALTSTAGSAPAAIDRLPDIIVRQSDLFDHEIDSTVLPGRIHLRLSNGTANVGTGPLYLHPTTAPNPDSTQDVTQRIFRDDGSWWERLAGVFDYHPSHGHMHFEDWASYRLRAVSSNNQIGPVVAEGEKVSFCIIDFYEYDFSLPFANPLGQFHDCGSDSQGLSVGWIDVYSKDLPDQWIDVTDVENGHYWLESEVDPVNRVVDADETNNVSRIRMEMCLDGFVAPADDSIWLSDGIGPPGGVVAVDVGLANSRLTEGVIVAFSWAGAYNLQYDSVTLSSRTIAFQPPVLIALDPFNFAAAVSITAQPGMLSPLLDSGSGTVGRLWFTIPSGASGTPNPITLTVAGGYIPTVSIACGQYLPQTVIHGSVGLGCCVTAGDASHAGGISIADALHLINYIFQSGAAPVCDAEGDADGGGDINIGDALVIIDYIFGGPLPDPICGP